MEELDKLSNQLDHVSGHGPQALATWDSIAARLLTLIDNTVTSHRTERGELLPVIRNLASQVADIETIAHARQATYLKDHPQPDFDHLAYRLSAHHRSEESSGQQASSLVAARRTGTIPVPPLVVLLAIGIAVAVGAYVLPSTEPDSEVRTVDTIVPLELTSRDISALPVIDVPPVADRKVTTLEIEDQAELIDDKKLTDDIARIPFTAPTSLQILTTPHDLPGGEITPQAGLSEIFPDYFEAETDRYLGEADYLIVIAGGGDQTALIAPYGAPIRFDDNWNPRAELETVIDDPHIAVWNTVASMSNLDRDASFDTGGVDTREDSVATSWLWVIGAFLLALLILTIISYLIGRRRRHRANISELAAIMTTIALSHDALELKINALEQRWPGLVGPRYRNWHANYLRVLQQCHDDDIDNHEFGGSPRNVRRNLRHALYIQAKRESLYRSGDILSQRPGWIDQVSEDLRILAWADADSATRVRDDIVRQLRGSEDINPVLVVSALHSAALESKRGIAWWCLQESGPHTLSSQARQAEPVLTLSPHVVVGSYFLIDQYVFASGQEHHMPQFLDLDMGSLAWMRQAGEYVSISLVTRARRLWILVTTAGSAVGKVAILGLMLGGLILSGLALNLVLYLVQGNTYGVLVHSSDPDIRPIDTAVVGLEDAEEERAIADQLESLPIGIPQRVVFIASATQCDTGQLGIQGIDIPAGELDSFVATYDDRLVLRGGTTLVCFSETDSAIIHDTSTTESDRLEDALNDSDSQQPMSERMRELIASMAEAEEPILERSRFLSAPYAQVAGYTD